MIRETSGLLLWLGAGAALHLIFVGAHLDPQSAWMWAWVLAWPVMLLYEILVGLVYLVLAALAVVFVMILWGMVEILIERRQRRRDRDA